MKKIKEIVRTLRNCAKVARKISTHRWSEFLVFLDIIYCMIRFHATSDEYWKYCFYNYSNRYRKNFLLTYHQKKLVQRINEQKFTYSKYGFYLKIPEIFHREMILAPSCGEEAFVAFVKKHGCVIVKPDTGSCGRNIELLIYIEDELIRQYYAGLKENTVCEECICQHEKMNELNPYSVNTIRIVSLLEQDEVTVISATVKTGRKYGVFVDNMNQKGIGAHVDVSTGIITTFGFDYNYGVYVKHPVTGTQFIGFNIPNWEIALDTVKNAHKKLPQCKLLGWDIAITPTGVDIVEANNAPGVPLMQFGDKIPKGEKILCVMKQAPKVKKQKSAE